MCSKIIRSSGIWPSEQCHLYSVFVTQISNKADITSLRLISWGGWWQWYTVQNSIKNKQTQAIAVNST